MFILQITRNT